MYSEILIDDVFAGYKMNTGDEMKNLSRINILIGKNNSGKSRFLRTMFAAKGITYRSSELDFQDALKELSDAAQEAKISLDRRNLQEPNDAAIVRQMKIDSAWCSPLLQNIMDNIAQLHRDIDIHATGNTEHQIIQPLLLPKIITFENRINEEKALAKQVKRIYIPTLRGLRPLQVKRDAEGKILNDDFDGLIDNYLMRTESDYFEKPVERSRIITGLHLYDETKRLLLGNLADREKVKAFEEFIGKTFFDGNPFSITPQIDDDVVHVRIGNQERPIYELGDGIQAIIILTYSLFFHKDETALIFFEEPETHLHPGLQRLFIETLRNPDFESFQYFITTHSNHFLDLTADYDDISVYTFTKKEVEKEESYVIENVENEFGNVLQLLGARVSSVFLSNCTIWVEGITDRLYLRKYLEVWQQHCARKFKEDYHYSFVEYGGNNITHWSFLDADDPNHLPINVERLCSKLFLITDKDGAGMKKDGTENKNADKKYQRHLQLEKKLPERYHCLESREIENLLTKEVVKKVIIVRENRSDIDFTQFDRAKKYDSEQMGTFIKNTIPEAKRKYKANSGTIHDKVGFCKIAVDQIKSLDDLSEEAKHICKKLYDFIAENNK